MHFTNSTFKAWCGVQVQLLDQFLAYHEHTNLKPNLTYFIATYMLLLHFYIYHGNVTIDENTDVNFKCMQL